MPVQLILDYCPHCYVRLALADRVTCSHCSKPLNSAVNLHCRVGKTFPSGKGLRRLQLVGSDRSTRVL